MHASMYNFKLRLPLLVDVYLHTHVYTYIHAHMRAYTQNDIVALKNVSDN